MTSKEIRSLPPCARHKAEENVGNGVRCSIPRIDNALFRASTCNDCLAIVRTAI